MRTRLVILLSSVFAVGLAAPAASDVTLVEEEYERGRYSFAAQPCGAPATVRVFLPQKARSIVVSEPGEGVPIRSFTGERGGQIVDVTVDRSGRRPKVVWTAEATPLLCSGDGWESSRMFFEVRYKVRRAVRLGGAAARRYAHRALARTFGASFTHATGRSLSCRRRSSIRVRCQGGWFIGDVVWGGRITVWLSKARGELRWNYRLDITRVNEYCEQVVQGTNCRRRVQRTRLNLAP